jgi:hypothetical protein
LQKGFRQKRGTGNLGGMCRSTFFPSPLFQTAKKFQQPIKAERETRGPLHTQQPNNKNIRWKKEEKASFAAKNLFKRDSEK